MFCPKHKDVECKEGKSRCDVCLDTLRAYQSNRRKSLIDAGHCVGTVGRSKCQNAPRPDKTMCQECADTFNKYQLGRLAARKAENK